MNPDPTKQELLTIVHKITERYKYLKIPKDLKNESDKLVGWVKLFRIIEYPDEYKSDEPTIIFGFTGDYGIIHRIPGPGQEWSNLVFLESLIITFCSCYDKDILYPQSEDTETKLIEILKKVGSKQYIKGLASTLRSDKKLSQGRLLNKIVHCDDKEEDIPQRFRGKTNIFSGEWTEEKLEMSREILIDILIENPHHIPLLDELSSGVSIDEKLKQSHEIIIRKLLLSQTTELGDIKSVLNSCYNWNEMYDDLEKLRTFRPYITISDILALSVTGLFIQSKIDSGEWVFKKPGAVKRELAATKARFIQEVNGSRSNGLDSITHLRHLKESNRGS